MSKEFRRYWAYPTDLGTNKEKVNVVPISEMPEIIRGLTEGLELIEIAAVEELQKQILLLQEEIKLKRAAKCFTDNVGLRLDKEKLMKAVEIMIKNSDVGFLKSTNSCSDEAIVFAKEAIDEVGKNE